ncbi:C-type lectin domain family 12 member B-like [Sebastes umbrosus]|uniref:C-type lectin domain family 12 member B-like n=1 Tax=Sebastes umbrosus TaxID=72105 RepID=UPI00189E4FCE|nr:C-type lectin domain family 12 member B-like [Sebastes umbrosus]
MSEEEVNYASVVFKNKKHPPPEAIKEEEIVYDEVKVRGETPKQTSDSNAGLLPDKKANKRRRHYQQLACCLGILCVILLLGIIALCVLHQSKTTSLTAENQKLSTRNQELETQKNNLTAQIRDMETNWNELNVSRAQWSIDAYCPKTNNDRECKVCQDGWKYNDTTKPSCYAINNAAHPNRRTWEEAREDCRGKNSNFTVIHDEKEKKVINAYSWGSKGTNGYWIGLRVEDGKWKWIDGSDLTVNYWAQPPPTPPPFGHCAISFEKEGWKSVRCDVRQQWICEKNALSL